MTRLNIPKIRDAVEFKRTVAIRDAVEYMEGENLSDDMISLLGAFNVYEDGTMVFTWKGKDAVVFAPLRLDEDRKLVVEFERLYLSDNNDKEFK